MTQDVLTAFALFVAGTLVGIEYAVGFFVHPTLWRMTDEVHAAAAKALARVFGCAMPIWYALALLTTSLVAYSAHLPERARVAWFSAGLWLVSIAFTLVFPLPINNRIAALEVASLPPEWKALRQRWDRLHVFRNLIITAALIALIWATGIR